MMDNIWLVLAVGFVIFTILSNHQKSELIAFLMKMKYFQLCIDKIYPLSIFSHIYPKKV